MQPANTVRLKALSEITGRSRETIRNMQKLGQTPWDDTAFADAAQRRYSGLHALALVVAEGLTAQGLSFTAAGEAVRLQLNVLDMFLDEVDLGRPVTPRFVSVFHELWNDTLTGLQWEPLVQVGYGTAEELADIFAGILEGAGRVKDKGEGRTKRHLAGPWVVVQSLPSAYRMLQGRAAEAGYRIDGRAIIANRAPESDSEDSE